MSTQQIPREFIQQVLDRTEIVDLIDGRLPLRKKSGNNYFACCPFHNEKSASFSVSQHKQFYYCFGCGAHGNAIDFLMQYDRLSFPEAIEALAKLAGLALPQTVTVAAKPQADPNLYELLTQVAKCYQAALRDAPQAIAYLKQRGLSGQIAKEFGIGYAPSGWEFILQKLGHSAAEKKHLLDAGILIKKEDHNYYDRFRERIMFPIHDRRGRVIGFGGRILDKGEPKYLNSPETTIFQKGHELYGLYQVLQAHRQVPRIIMVEGYMDVIALFQHGVNYAVATLGTATTTHHLQRLLRYTSEIIFCFDGDQAGRTAAWRALQVVLPLMRDTLQVRFMFLPDGEDPDSMIRKEGKTAFEQRSSAALSLSAFFFQELAKQTDLSTMDGRARLVALGQDYLKQLPPGVFQQMMQEELAKKARIDANQLTTASPSQQRPRPAKSLRVRTPSALRLAITLLVQQPTLAQELTEPLPALDTQGFALLHELMQMIQTQAIQTTGALLEQWRERKEADLLAKLAQVEHMIPVDGIKNEFIGAITRLKKRAHEQVIAKIMTKAARDELTPEEKKHLNELIYSSK